MAVLTVMSSAASYVPCVSSSQRSEREGGYALCYVPLSAMYNTEDDL